jgi:hypothetical protein
VRMLRNPGVAERLNSSWIQVLAVACSAAREGLAGQA